jgi:hypothetical protein
VESGSGSFELPPGPVRRQLRRATGMDITPDDFAPDEQDQLHLWVLAQKQARGSRRHRSGRSRRRFWSPKGR